MAFATDAQRRWFFAHLGDHPAAIDGEVMTPDEARSIPHAEEAKRLANMSKEDFEAAIRNGVTIDMFRGISKEGATEGAPEWFASNPQTAIRYAKDEHGTVRRIPLTMKRPYIAAGMELANTTPETIKRIKALGHDGMITQFAIWPKGEKIQKEIWAVRFR